MTTKRFRKKGGVDTSSTIPYNDLPVNNNADSEDTTSQGSMHLSDLNVSTDSMASGLTTNESTESGNGYFANTNTHGIGGKRSKRKSKKSKRKTKRKSKKSKRKSKKSKRKSRKSRKGGADEDTSPTPINEKENDMMNYFK